MKLIGLSGSLRNGSYNTALLRSALDLVPNGVDLTIGTIQGIPLYNGDIETSEGIPESVKTLKNMITNADGLIIASPEYNNSIPGVLKNVIDWLSRPPAAVSPVFNGKPVAIMGATPGAYGTILSQDAWLSVLRALQTRPWFGGRLMVARAEKVFDPAGGIIDEAVREQLRQFVQGFVEFVRSPAS